MIGNVIFNVFKDNKVKLYILENIAKYCYKDIQMIHNNNT